MTSRAQKPFVREKAYRKFDFLALMWEKLQKQRASDNGTKNIIGQILAQFKDFSLTKQKPIPRMDNRWIGKTTSKESDLKSKHRPFDVGRISQNDRQAVGFGSNCPSHSEFVSSKRFSESHTYRLVRRTTLSELRSHLIPFECYLFIPL